MKNTSFWPLQFLRSKWYTFAYLFIYDVWILRGNEAKSGEAFSVACAGFETSKNYFKKLIFDNVCEEKALGRMWLWALKKKAAAGFEDCSLLICEVPEAKLGFFSLKSSVKMPAWLSMEIDLTESMENLLKKEKLRKMNQKVIKSGLRYEPRSDEASFDDFYLNMYLPYIRARHDNKAVIYDSAYVKKGLFSGSQKLYFVMKDELAIGGFILDFSEPVPRFWCMGVLGGKEEYLKMGVSEAADIFSFLMVKEKGGTAINMGHCRPFLEDGVFQYKLRLGAHIKSHHKGSGFFDLLFLKKDKALEAFLKNHPFISIDEKGKYQEFAAGDGL